MTAARQSRQEKVDECIVSADSTKDGEGNLAMPCTIAGEQAEYDLDQLLPSTFLQEPGGGAQRTFLISRPRGGAYRFRHGMP